MRIFLPLKIFIKLPSPKIHLTFADFLVTQNFGKTLNNYCPPLTYAYKNIKIPPKRAKPKIYPRNEQNFFGLLRKKNSKKSKNLFFKYTSLVPKSTTNILSILFSLLFINSYQQIYAPLFDDFFLLKGFLCFGRKHVLVLIIFAHSSFRGRSLNKLDLGLKVKWMFWGF